MGWLLLLLLYPIEQKQIPEGSVCWDPDTEVQTNHHVFTGLRLGYKSFHHFFQGCG